MVGYTRRLDVWLTGAGSESEMTARLAQASATTPDLLEQRVRAAAGEDWWARLEGLAESARAVEELGRPGIGAYPLDESPARTPGGVALLGAIEDSLILELDAQEPNHALRATADQIYNLLIAARGEGVWKWMQPAGDAYPDPLYVPTRPAGLDISETVAPFRGLMKVATESADFYRQLSPDGRELSDRERLDVREHLTRGLGTSRAARPVSPSCTTAVGAGAAAGLRIGGVISL